MFKTARMRKIRIVTLDEYISPTVSALHEQGLVQINEISDSIQQDPELAELVTPSKASAFTGKLSSLLMKTSAISELLGNSLSEGHGIKDTMKTFWLKLKVKQKLLKVNFPHSTLKQVY